MTTSRKKYNLMMTNKPTWHLHLNTFTFAFMCNLSTGKFDFDAKTFIK